MEHDGRGRTVRLTRWEAPLRLAGVLLACGLIATCDDPDPAETDSGRVIATAVTTGSELDQDGYLLTVVGVNDGSPQVLPANGSATVDLVPAGARTVRVGGVADNCTLTGDAQRNVTVESNADTPVDVAVTCEPTSGTVRIRTATSGAPLDPDGYRVRLDADTLPIGVTDTLDVDTVPPGQLDVELLDVASECTVQSDNPATVDIVAGDTAQVDFAITCAAAAAIVFVSDRSGSGVDLHVLDPDTRSVEPVTTDGVTKQFARWSPDRSRIAFARQVPAGLEIATVASDGSDLRSVSAVTGTNWSPSWSPDGTRIAWANQDEGAIYVANADGTGEAPIPLFPPVADWPDWSPDGMTLVFTLGNTLHTMAPDGSGLTSLGVDGIWPRWSPDGTRLVYAAAGTGGVLRVWVADFDGSDAVEIVTDRSPLSVDGWSPDGAWVLFSNDGPPGTQDLIRVRPDGTGLELLTTDVGLDAWGDWR